MQLFVCDFQIKNNQISIEDQNILYQLRKVLRSRIWDIIFVQKSWNADMRYEIKIDHRDDKKLLWEIQSVITKPNPANRTYIGMIVCMPNKWDKAELIVQKLTEIWINHIVFWPSERSVIRDANSTKIDRLEKISREALEQSWWWNLPSIEFVDDIKNIVENMNLLVFDKSQIVDQKSQLETGLKIYWLVGPEGWLTESDYKKFGSHYEIKSLGENILRTETAAILWWWEIKNLKYWNLQL